MAPKKKDPDARIAAQTVQAGSCIEWTGHRTKGGYGQFSVEGQPTYVHRYVYKRDCGEIPEGFFVMHSCDNPPCCNPAHLTVGTNRDNCEDRDSKGRQARGGRAGRATLMDPDKVRQARAMVAAGQTQTAVGITFGVDPTVINNIIKGRTWNWVN